jgi:hypothetical protein
MLVRVRARSGVVWRKPVSSRVGHGAMPTLRRATATGSGVGIHGARQEPSSVERSRSTRCRPGASPAPWSRTGVGAAQRRDAHTPRARARCATARAGREPRPHRERARGAPPSTHACGREHRAGRHAGPNRRRQTSPRCDRVAPDRWCRGRAAAPTRRRRACAPTASACSAPVSGFQTTPTDLTPLV